MKKMLYTIGHSTHSSENFILLLKKYIITAVVDVRSTPYSRFSIQFNKENIQKYLNSYGIKYVFLGKELGARSHDLSCYVGNKIKYQYLAKTNLFQKGLQRIKEGFKKYNIALMCAEKEPLNCHRTILISRHLFDDGFNIKHILADGNLESYIDSINRLMDITGIPKDDMFATKEELYCKTLDKQSENIAYSKTSSKN